MLYGMRFLVVVCFQEKSNFTLFTILNEFKLREVVE